MSKRIVISALSSIEPDSMSPNSENHLNVGDTHFIKADFDTRNALGKKGTRTLDRLTGMTIHCIGQVISESKTLLEQNSERVGLVVGTAQGSMDSIVRFTYESLAHDSPDYVNPALFPNTVMNCAAGQSAIWHGLKGPNATISCGEISAFAALNYAVSLLKNNYADSLVAGASEELSEVNIAAKSAFADKLNSSAKFTEGSAFYLVESENISAKNRRTALVTIDSVQVGFNPQKNDAAALVQLISRTLSEANISPENINLVSISGSWPQTSEVECLALEQIFGAATTPSYRKLVQYEVTGNASSTQNAFQLVTALRELGEGERALLFAQDLKGNIGALLLTKQGTEETPRKGDHQ